MTAAERLVRNRLRSERWRRAHGIGPRRPAQRPWLAEGISRSTWYRRRPRGQEASIAAVGTWWSYRPSLFSRDQIVEIYVLPRECRRSPAYEE
jgi:hypothetical protein